MFPRAFFWAAVFGAIGGIIKMRCFNAVVGRLEKNRGDIHEEPSSHSPECEKGFCLAAVCGALGGIFTVLCMSAAWRADEAEDAIMESRFEKFEKEAQEHDERDP